MITRKGSAAIAFVIAAIILLGVGGNAAQAQTGQPYLGRVYTLHIKPYKGCPSLDWHLVVGENHTLSGMIALDNMKTIYRVTGTFDPGKTFRLDGKQVDGTGGIAVNGKIQPTGLLEATLGDFPVGSPCQGRVIYVPWGNSPVINYDEGGSG